MNKNCTVWCSELDDLNGQNIVTIETIKIISLRSYRSDKYPIKYWFKAPPIIKVNIKIDTCSMLNPLLTP